MFTGIIETTGKVISLAKEKNNLIIEVESSIAKELKIGQSVAHNGVCLTVESKNKKNRYIVTAVKETLTKTNLGSFKKGSIINLERSLKIGDRLDGHFVQGHVDTIANVKSIAKDKGSWIFAFEISRSHPDNYRDSNLIVDKGSICINGASLTIIKALNTKPKTSDSPLIFSVAIIPHTFKHTNFNMLKKSDMVNIEFDVLGKYINKNLSLITQSV